MNVHSFTSGKSMALLMLFFCTSAMNVHATEARITYIEHDGFIIQSDNRTFYVDITIKPNDSLPSPDAIFITHNHADHYVKSVVTDIAGTSGAYVVGPQPVMSTLSGSLPGTQLITYTPATGTKMSDSLLDVDITIYGSYDGTNQNSYRFAFPSGFVIYHNGDMPGVQFGSFVSGGCTELLNMNIAMLDSWAYTISDFYSSYSPHVMIKMHMWSSPCVVYPDYPNSFALTADSTYTYLYTDITENRNPENDIEVFCNPLSNTTSIHFSNTTNESHTLTIYNTNGQAVRRIENISYEVTEVDPMMLGKGMYLFQLQNKNRIVGSGKFIME